MRILLSALTIFAFAGSAVRAEPTTLKLYSLAYDIDAVAIASEVTTRTQGRYRIETFNGFDMLNGELGKERAGRGEKALIEGVQNGDLDLVITGAAPLGNYVTEVNVLMVPFLFRDYAHSRAVLDGPIGQAMLAALPAHGLVGLAWTENGMRHLTNNLRPIHRPEDLRGVRLRTQENPIIIEAFRALGADVRPLPWNQALFDALGRGDLDAQENPASTVREFGIFGFQKYLSLSGHICAPAVTVMSASAYDRLSPADKIAFVESARSGARLHREYNEQGEDTAIVDLLSLGMKVNADVDKAAFRAALAPLYAEWHQQFGDLIDRIQAYP